MGGDTMKRKDTMKEFTLCVRNWKSGHAFYVKKGFPSANEASRFCARITLSGGPYTCGKLYAFGNTKAEYLI